MAQYKSQSDAVQAAEHILAIQQEHTDIYYDDDGPLAVTHPDFRFHHLLKDDIIATQDLRETAELHIWKLGHALFDELPETNLPEDATSLQRNHINRLRRRLALSEWLEEAVAGPVEEELRSISSSASSASTAASTIFTLLTGHQIERAVQSAIENGDMHLATLLAQAGGDEEFRSDLFLQLQKWREYRVDSHIDDVYRKIYELLSGNIDTVEGHQPSDPVDGCSSLFIPKSLDWKRVFGLHLWYGPFESSTESCVQRYEESFASTSSKQIPAKPLPWYEETAAKVKNLQLWKNASTQSTIWDPAFELLKVATGQSDGLEQALLPRGFTPSPLDYRLSWHCYTLLSKALRVADFADRIDAKDILDADQSIDETAYPNWSSSATADQLTEDYAYQLEVMGLWERAIFVLLHLSQATA